jgi:hypothetical protein
MTRLLILTNEGREELGSSFDEVTRSSLAEVMITTNGSQRILVDGEEIENWDSVFVEPETKAFNYTRILLEVLRQKDIRTNISQSCFFMMAKKPYLFKVLSEKGLAMPKTATISTNKGLTEIERDIDGPCWPKGMRPRKGGDRTDRGLEELDEFTDGMVHGENFAVLQEYPGGDIYDVLYVDGNVTPLRLEGKPWETPDKDIKRKYHGLKSGEEELVKKAAESLGSRMFRARLMGGKITSLSTDLMLQTFQEDSGKNVYGQVEELLQGDED